MKHLINFLEDLEFIYGDLRTPDYVVMVVMGIVELGFVLVILKALKLLPF
jgi:hypothetical protein